MVFGEYVSNGPAKAGVSIVGRRAKEREKAGEMEVMQRNDVRAYVAIKVMTTIILTRLRAKKAPKGDEVTATMAMRL